MQKAVKTVIVQNEIIHGYRVLRTENPHQSHHMLANVRSLPLPNTTSLSACHMRITPLLYDLSFGLGQNKLSFWIW
jgi:hypothetical protein